MPTLPGLGSPDDADHRPQTSTHPEPSGGDTDPVPEAEAFAARSAPPTNPSAAPGPGSTGAPPSRPPSTIP